MPIPYVIFQLAALLGAGGQALYKVAADRKQQPATAEGHLLPMVLGVVVYCGALALFVLAFSYGGEVGALYATYSTTFLWSLLLGRLFWGEAITKKKLLGVALVMGGVSLVTAS